MDDAKLIVEVGKALWGDSWQGPMADALRHQKGTVSDWRRGRMPVPAGVWRELAALIQDRREVLAPLHAQVLAAADAPRPE